MRTNRLKADNQDVTLIWEEQESAVSLHAEEGSQSAQGNYNNAMVQEKGLDAAIDVVVIRLAR